MVIACARYVLNIQLYHEFRDSGQEKETPTRPITVVNRSLNKTEGAPCQRFADRIAANNHVASSWAIFLKLYHQARILETLRNQKM